MPRSLLTVSVVVFTLFILAAAQVSAQDPRQQRRRAFVEDLLKTLIESQADKGDPRGGRPFDPNYNNPRRPQPNQPIKPVKPIRNASATAEMLQARKLLKKMAEGSENLIYELKNHELKYPQLRPLLADALRVRASVDVLMRRCSVMADLVPLRQNFMAIDRQWRMLNHQLTQFESLPPSCLKCINDIHTHEEQLCNAFGIQPQFDRRELARLANTMNSELDHLVRDVYYELNGTPDQRKIIKRGQMLQAQVRQYAPLINHGSYDEIVVAFKSCMVNWRAFNRELSKYPNDRIRHSVGELEDAGRQMHGLLWLPIELDREYYAHLCTTMDTDLQKVFQQISLADLMNCKVPGAVLTCSREFRKKCTAFGTRVSGNGSMEDLRWNYRAFDNQWRDLTEHCRGFKRPDLDRRIAEIEYQMDILRNTFGTEILINHHQLLQMCGELDQWVHELHDSIHQTKANSYAGTMYRDMCGCCDQLQSTCHGLHTQVLASRKVNDYRLQMDACFKEWARLKTFMNQCNDKDRRRFARYRSQIEPLMVKLQVIYSE